MQALRLAFEVANPVLVVIHVLMVEMCTYLQNHLY